MKLQEKILYCRKKKGLSQEALAEQMGVSRQAISKWETGEATPEVSKLSLLAKNFDVTVDWLISEEEPEEETVKVQNIQNNEFGIFNENSKGIFGKVFQLIKKYSWIAGLYIALSGLIFFGFGLGARVMFRSILGLGESQMEQMNKEYEESVDDLMMFGGEMANVPMEDSFSEMENPVSPMTKITDGFTGVIMIIGGLIMIAGIGLTIWLKIKLGNTTV